MVCRARPTRTSRARSRLFSKLFPGRRFGGGALAVYLDGRPVVDVWTGYSDRRGEVRWSADTGAMVFSATKGVAATVIHRLVDRGLLSYDAPVAEFWPEFGANGKSCHHGRGTCCGTGPVCPTSTEPARPSCSTIW